MRPEGVAAAVKGEMKAAGVQHAFAMGEWDAGESDPLGVARTLQIAALVPGLRAVGVCDPAPRRRPRPPCGGWRRS